MVDRQAFKVGLGQNPAAEFVDTVKKPRRQGVARAQVGATGIPDTVHPIPQQLAQHAHEGPGR